MSEGAGAACGARATRATRDQRQADLLVHAAALVLEQGGLPLPFDRLARAAGVSKALVYHHFPTQAALALALLADEWEAIDWPALAAAMDLDDAGDAARAVATRYFDVVATRGPLLHLLLTDPVVAQGEDRAVAVRAALRLRRLTRRIADTLRLSPREANVVLHLLMTYPEEAGRKVFRGEANRALARALCGDAVAAGLAALAGARDEEAMLGADLL
ncbi:TetR/AcrR family transcriptional regulator [Sphingomonas adhaesiva]|uniref:TetR/AcrR family transcriptional regulator n=1 Tax=Sphingomonas adhaesiva TaxID=28212 RepID=UPI002FF672B8